MENLIDRISELVRVTGWSQKRVASEAGASKSAVSHWLSGKTTSLSAKSAANLSRNSGFSAGWLIDGSGDMLGQSATHPIQSMGGLPDAPDRRKMLPVDELLAQLAVALDDKSVSARKHVAMMLSSFVMEPEDRDSSVQVLVSMLGFRKNLNPDKGLQLKYTSSQR